VSKRFSLTLSVAIVSVACGAGTNPGAPTSESTSGVGMPSLASPHAAVTIAVSPSPVASTDSGDPRAPREARWQIVLRETGGVGATVNFVNATLRDATTGVLADPHGVLSQSSSDVLAAAGSNHLAAGGALAVPQVVTFVLASGATAPGRLEVTVQLTDDAGNVVGASATAAVE
jgi:hypothetical protein